MININLTTHEGATATGVFFPNNPKNKKITINAGSILTIDPYAQGVASNIQQNYDRAALAHQDGILRQINHGTYEVVRNLTGLSVSGASVIVTGQAGSGWKKWRLDNGQFLDVFRSSAGIIASSQTVTPPSPRTVPPSGTPPPVINSSPSADPSKKPPCCQIPPGPRGRFLTSLRKDVESFSQFVGNGNPDILLAEKPALTSALHLEMKLWIPNGYLPQRYRANDARHNSWEAMRQRARNTFSADSKNQLFDQINSQFPTRTSCALLEYDDWLVKTILFVNAAGLAAPNAVPAAIASKPTTLATIGHAQKILNIYVKYQFCWQRKGQWINGNFTPPYASPINTNEFLCALHAPIDRILLRTLNKYAVGHFLQQNQWLSAMPLRNSGRDFFY